jgi:hypothetical protein
MTLKLQTTLKLQRPPVWLCPAMCKKYVLPLDTLVTFSSQRSCLSGLSAPRWSMLVDWLQCAGPLVRTPEAWRCCSSRRTCNSSAAESPLQLPFQTLCFSTDIVFKVAASTVVPGALPPAFLINAFYPQICNVGSMGHRPVYGCKWLWRCCRSAATTSATQVV